MGWSYCCLMGIEPEGSKKQPGGLFCPRWSRPQTGDSHYPQYRIRIPEWGGVIVA